MPYADPEKQRAANRESARRRRAGEPRRTGVTRRTTDPGLQELKLSTATQVIEMLTEQARIVRDDPDLKSPERCRCLVYLGSVLLSAIQVGNLEDRILSLELTMDKQDGATSWH